ncbi:MAG: hypothetical protein ACRD4S_04080 [Candidatus Acidiferrales bacterium]
MRTLWRGLVRIVFWSYERGSWPYDVMVIAIVIFVLATPRAWFHDQPRRRAPAGQTPSARTSTYRLDAALFPPENTPSRITPELERKTHDVLEGSVGELKGQTFQVIRIDPVRASDGSVLYYDVTVHR